MSDITNPPMDDDSNGSPSAEPALGGEEITNPPMDDDRSGGPAPGFSIENPPA